MLAFLALLACPRENPSPGDTTDPTDGQCEGVAPPGECFACAESKCCEAILACTGDAECGRCLSGDEDAVVCQANAAATALSLCAAEQCGAECEENYPHAGSCARYCCTDGDCGAGTCDKAFFGLPDVGVCLDATSEPVCAVDEAPTGACAASYACNPITNEGCGAGEVCDYGTNASGTAFVFQCFPPPNEASLCDACDNVGGPFCGPGLTCYVR